MKRLITFLFAFTVLCAASVPLMAMNFASGETLHHGLSICLNKADAIAIADAEKEGHAAAEAAWEANPACGNVPVSGGVVGNVVHTVKAGDKTYLVVEILSGTEVVAYFLTSGKVEAKRDRDA